MNSKQPSAFRGSVAGSGIRPRPAALEDTTNGRRWISTRGFDGFRVTWITFALAAGDPLEMVRRVTGHRTVEIVMRHHFPPAREDLRVGHLQGDADDVGR
ncbi:MAG: hypothetical protein HS113_23225 [Verrucomicrobiales bacterium]|nr:hypothetical protein [Verrucomicrobiales bacterium]